MVEEKTVEPTKEMLEDAHKFAFLVEQYPNHNLKQILGLFAGTAPIGANCAVWVAEDQGLVEIDSANNKVTLKDKPAVWDFGNTVKELETRLEYAFRKVAKNEGDFEETYLGNWTDKYAAIDVTIAVRSLIVRGVFATYGINDTQKDGVINEYVFYTLAENLDKHWGAKQFKDQNRLTFVEVKPEEPTEEIPDAPAEQDEAIDNAQA